MRREGRTPTTPQSPRPIEHIQRDRSHPRQKMKGIRSTTTGSYRYVEDMVKGKTG